MLGLLLNICVFILFIGIIFMFEKIGEKLAEKKVKGERTKEFDFDKEKAYFREILEGYSPGELIYVNEFKIEPKRAIVATLLSLENKKKIKIQNNKIAIINDNTEDLKQTEKFVFDNINEDGKVEIEDWDYIEVYADQEALEDKLLVRENANGKTKRYYWQIKLLEALMAVIFIIICINIEKINELNLPSGVIISGFIIICIAFFGVGIFEYSFLGNYWIMQLRRIKRTEKGEEINKKLEGLKMYEKDFGNLSSKQKNELIIWEEYLIYSVIFNINNKILKEMKFRDGLKISLDKLKK